EIGCGWGMRKIGFVRGCYSEHKAKFLRKSHLVAPTFLPFPPTRFILEPTVVGTAKSLFFCVFFRNRKSDFAVLIADAVRLELVEWCLPGTRTTRPPGARAPGTRAIEPAPLRAVLLSLWPSA